MINKSIYSTVQFWTVKINILLLKFLESQMPDHFNNVFNNILNRFLFNPPLGGRITIRPEFAPHTVEVCRCNFFPRLVDVLDCINCVVPTPEFFDVSKCPISFEGNASFNLLGLWHLKRSGTNEMATKININSLSKL